MDSKVAYIKAQVFIPLSSLTVAMLEKIRGDLRVRIRDTYTNEFSTVDAYVMHQYHIEVPKYYGLQLLQSMPDVTVNLDVVQGFYLPLDRGPDPLHKLAPIGQKKTMEDVKAHMEQNLTTLLKSPTGSGKTAIALDAIKHFGRSALVVVPHSRSFEGWRRDIKKFCGLSDDQIGEVGGGKASYLLKPITIAMIHSVAMKDFDEEFYTHFGTVVFDEVELLGAKVFSKAMRKFPANYVLGMSATPKRKDGGDKVFLHHFGPVAVEGSSKALPCICRVVRFDTVIPNHAKMPRSILLKCLTLNRERNKKIAEILYRAYNMDRDILAVSDRIDQLRMVGDMLLDWGVPSKHIGYATPQISKTEEEMQEAMKAPITLGSYKLFERATDIPWKDTGIDLSPRASGEQIVGRIRRPYDGKSKKSTWITIVDERIPIFANMAKSRLRDIEKSGVEIVQ